MIEKFMVNKEPWLWTRQHLHEGCSLSGFYRRSIRHNRELCSTPPGTLVPWPELVLFLSLNLALCLLFGWTGCSPVQSKVEKRKKSFSHVEFTLKACIVYRNALSIRIATDRQIMIELTKTSLTQTPKTYSIAQHIKLQSRTQYWAKTRPCTL